MDKLKLLLSFLVLKLHFSKHATIFPITQLFYAPIEQFHTYLDSDIFMSNLWKKSKFNSRHNPHLHFYIDEYPKKYARPSSYQLLAFSTFSPAMNASSIVKSEEIQFELFIFFRRVQRPMEFSITLLGCDSIFGHNPRRTRRIEIPPLIRHIVKTGAIILTHR